MLLEWKTKRFETLSSLELYELLKLRSEVFVVEQNCVYLDIDGKDANLFWRKQNYHFGAIISEEILRKSRFYSNQRNVFGR